jgi:integrative and conjugative element protein (TIGR02256 family)
MQLNKKINQKMFIRHSDGCLVYGDKKLEIHINISVVSTLKTYRQLEPHQHEKGGILIGYFSENKIYIDDLTHPFLLDKSSRNSFYRQDPMHDKILQAHWLLSNHKRGFAGDWHTHPEKKPTASSIDLHGWTNQIQQPHPYVFLIQGIEKLTVYLIHGSK